RSGRRLAVHVAQADDFHRRNLNQVKQIRFSVPTAADERDAQRLIFIGGKEARFRDRQSNGSGTSFFQEIAASHTTERLFQACVETSQGWAVHIKHRFGRRVTSSGRSSGRQ